MSETKPLRSSLHPSRSRRRPSGQPPPLPRPLERSGLVALGVLLFAAAIWMVVLLAPRLAAEVREAEAVFMVWVAEHRSDSVTGVVRPVFDLFYTWVLPTVGLVGLLTVIFVTKRVRSVMAFGLSLIMVVIVNSIVQQVAQRPRPYGVEILGRWEWYVHPYRFSAVLAAACTAVLLTLVPAGRARRLGIVVVAVLLALVAFTAVYLGVAHPTDIVMATVLGTCVPVLVVRLLAPPSVFPVKYGAGNAAHLDVSGERGAAIRRAVEDQLGYSVLDATPVGLAGSAGSTPLRLQVVDANGVESLLFAKLYATTHLRSDRWYKVGRTLLYGRLEDERKFASVRRLVQTEDYLAFKVNQADLRTPACHGVVELTPEREYLLVFDFLDGAVELGDAELTDDLIDRALRIVRGLWDAGLAHRDVKPANLMVTADGDVALIDVAFAQVRPSPWRQAVDLANMMIVLALRTDAERIYQRALLQFTADDIAEAFAASRGITLPSQVRRQLKQDSRDLLGEFRALGPARPRVAIQRWSFQRVLFTGWVLLLGILAVAVTMEFLRTTDLLP